MAVAAQRLAQLRDGGQDLPHRQAEADQAGRADQHVARVAADRFGRRGAHRLGIGAALGAGPGVGVAAVDDHAARHARRTRCSRSRLASTGGARNLFWVKTAAVGTGLPSSVASRADVAAASGLDARRQGPAATNPSAAVTLTDRLPMLDRPGALVEAEHQIGALDHLPRRALAEIVDRGERDDRAGALVVAGGEEGGVGAGRPFGLGRGLADMDEGLAGIGVAQDRQRVARAGRAGVAGGEDAAAGGHQVRGEQHLRAGHHLHLGGVAMVEEAVGAEIAVDRAEMRAGIGRAAGAADARGGVDDDALLLDRAGLDQRPQRQAGGGRVAAGRGDALRRLDLVAEKFGQAVGEAVEQLGPGVRLAVPALNSAALSRRKSAPRSTKGMPGASSRRPAAGSRHGARRRGSGRCP